jgi:transposase InsO family protein
VNVYPFIEAEKAQQRNVKRACELLEVSRAAYSAHRANIPSARQLADTQLTEHIRQAHQASKGRYGAPRIHAELRRLGHRHGRKRVARLMRARGPVRSPTAPVEADHDPRSVGRRPGGPDAPRLHRQRRGGQHSLVWRHRAPRGAVGSCGGERTPPPARRSGLVKLGAA